jgi:hypothetical protein
VLLGQPASIAGRKAANSSALRSERVGFLLSEVDLPLSGCSIHTLSEV